MINKKLLLATTVTALFLGGCLDSATGESQREANGDTSMVKKVVEKKAEAPKADKSATAQKASGGADTTACAGCHGVSFEKKAMGASRIVKDFSKEDIVKALKGYKDGTYGGGMKALMKGQVAGLSDADIDAIATKVAGGSAEAPAKEETPKADAPAEKIEEAPVAKKEAPAEKTEAPAKEEAPKSDVAPTVEVNTSACAACHGKDFEKKAMGVSKIVKDLTKAEIATALKGYKAGTYGGAMKALMQGQVAKLSDADMEAIANKFGK